MLVSLLVSFFCVVCVFLFVEAGVGLGGNRHKPRLAWPKPARPREGPDPVAGGLFGLGGEMLPCKLFEGIYSITTGDMPLSWDGGFKNPKSGNFSQWRA